MLAVKQCDLEVVEALLDVKANVAATNVSLIICVSRFVSFISFYFYFVLIFYFAAFFFFFFIFFFFFNFFV